MENKQHPHHELLKQWADDTSLILQELTRDGWQDRMQAGVEADIPTLLWDSAGEKTFRLIKNTGSKPFIDVKQVSTKWKWLAEDQDGFGWLFPKEPFINGWGWVSDGTGEVGVPHKVAAAAVDSYVAGTVHWKDSLVNLEELR